MFASLGKHHPEIKTFLFLVDDLHDTIDYSFFAPTEVVRVDETIAAEFPRLLERYDIIELNTAVRPPIIRYLQEKFPGTSKLYYLDPDLFIYGKLDAAGQLLETEDIIITPHFLQPVPIDGCIPFENLALNYGTYNMGFFGMNPGSSNSKSFLDWWEQRTSLFGHIDPCSGYFTDQVWLNLAPVFFKKVHTLSHPGYNMAAWNLHERRISSYGENGSIRLSSGDDLIVYHFSSWNFKTPGELSWVYNRYNFENRPDLQKLYKDYELALLENGIERFHTITCTLPYRKDMIKRSQMKKLLSPGVELMRKIWKRI